MKKNKEMALELMLEGTHTMQEIADIVKKSRQTLYNWLENEEFKVEYERRTEDMSRMARARLAKMSIKALDRAENILEHSNNDIAAASVVKDVLDRAGYSAENVVHVAAEAPVQIINNIPRSDSSG